MFGYRKLGEQRVPVSPCLRVEVEREYLNLFFLTGPQEGRDQVFLGEVALLQQAVRSVTARAASTVLSLKI